MRALWAVWGLLAVTLSGCYTDPAAPLIPLPEQPATVLPSQAAAKTEDGFPNIWADPASVPGVPRDPHKVEQAKKAVAAEGAYSRARTASIDRGSFAAEMRAKANAQTEDMRRRIQASSSSAGDAVAPSNPDDVRDRIAAGSSRETLSDGQSEASPAPQVDPGRPINPDEPAPRTVGPN
ncbi:hypothetical protein [Acuticoccus sediminis]|uniref:hypothetical protein n=1 Tax=Acuticoccus sediminis TaxID=2184697 RepID=UPI0011B93950|nr:hypothetical protein [Acuticoccus sediminis]